MKLTNINEYPTAYVEAAKSHTYPPKRGRIGVTQLIDSPQIRNLLLDHYDDIVLDVDDMFTAMLGTAWHKTLEENITKENIAEQKLEYEIEPGIVIAGKVDVTSGNTIEDYKLMACFSYIFDKTEWFEKQLNIYRWLLYKSKGITVGKLIIHLFFKDWTFYESQRNPDYPRARYLRQDIAIWPMEKTEEYIRQRIALHKNKDYKCSEEDKWVRLEKFAVSQKGKDRAMRLLDTFAEAEQYIVNKGLEADYTSGKVLITQRRTQPKRCESYCNCRSVCEYAKSLRK